MIDEARPVRIGVLGAARIVRDALIRPSTRVSGVSVDVIASRDVGRAITAAAKHGIPSAAGSYEEVLSDPSIDAVYIPLPTALHAEWTVRANRAGKHVLVEKPFAGNADDAKEVAETTAGSTSIVMEAYHSAFHPFYGHIIELAQSGELGPLTSATATFSVPVPPGDDIRWNYDLAGGGLLDIGYYPLRLLRDLFGPAPEVLGVRAKARGQVDRWLKADLQFGSVQGQLRSGMWTPRLGMGLVVVGERGTLNVRMPFHPQLGAKARIKSETGTRVEVADRRSSYDFQLEAFRDAVRGTSPVRTDAQAAVSQLAIIDRIYERAGLLPRPSGLGG